MKTAPVSETVTEPVPAQVEGAKSEEKIESPVEETPVEQAAVEPTEEKTE